MEKYNDTPSIVITGTADNDSITNKGYSVKINALGGDDTVVNRGYYVTINGGDGKDYLSNWGVNPNVKIYAGEGDDTISNYSDTVTIDGGDGNDTIQNYKSNNVSINGGAGDDSITAISTKYNTIEGGAGDDIIDNAGSYNTIEGGKGDDTIVNLDGADSGKNILIKYTEDDGSDLIEGFQSNSTLQIGDGSATYDINQSDENVLVAVGDEVVTLEGRTLSSVHIRGKKAQGVRIDNTQSKVEKVGTRANDTIFNDGNNVTINSNAGNDYIYDMGKNTTIDGGAGNDTIDNLSARATIRGGKGDDSIRLLGSTSNLVAYNAGDGNDIIANFKANSTLSIGSNAEYLLERHNDDVVITVGEGHITLTGTKNLNDLNIIGEKGYPVNLSNDRDYASMVGTRYDDTLTNTGEYVTINARDGNDSIENSGAITSIVAGYGNDTILNTGKKSTIDGGVGDDSISNNADSVSISGGMHNNQIFNHGNNVTITGAAYSKNTITNYAGSDKVFISGEGIYSVHNAGNNATISDVSRITNYYSTGSSIVGSTHPDIIDVQGGHNNTITGGKGKDTINLDSVNTNTLIQYKLGDKDKLINGFNTTSTLSIAEAQYSSEVSDNDIILRIYNPANDRLDSKITLTGAASLTSINLDSKEKPYPRNINNTLNAVKIVTADLNDTIENSGYNVTIQALAGNDTIYNRAQNVTIDAGDGSDTILNANENLVSIDGGGGNDLLNIQAGYQDTITGGKGNDTINLTAGTKQMIKYTTGDGNDIINGFNEDDTLQIGDGTGTYSKETRGDDIILSIGTGKITIKGAATLSAVNIIGEQREPAVYVSNSTDNVTITGGSSDDTVSNSGKNVTILLKGGNDTVFNSGKAAKINTDDGADTITNYGESAIIDTGADNDIITNGRMDYNGNRTASKSSINAGDGNDTIYNNMGESLSIIGGAGNDEIYNKGTYIASGPYDTNPTALYVENLTIEGGKGNDSIWLDVARNNLIQYTVGDGNDYISGFDATSSLSIAGNTYTTQKSGNDVIVNVYKDKITLAGAATLSKVNIIGEEEKTGDIINNSYSNTTITGTAFNDTITNGGHKVLVLAKGGNDSIYNGGDRVTIEGGAGNETITNKGSLANIIAGEGFDYISNTGDNSTLDGGAGNDTIWNEVGGEPSGGKKVSLVGGAGDDFIANDGDNSTIVGGAGDDTVKNWSANSKIDGGEGNDSINNEGNSVTIDGGAGDDTVTQRYRSNVLMDLGAGNDYIFNAYGSKNITINGGAGNDTIDNDGSKLSLSGGEGDDSISLYGGNDITVTGGTGSDSIYNRAASNVLFKYNAGDGNDVIQGFKTTSSISIGGGNYATTKVGNDLIITVGDGRITLQNAATLSKVNIIGTEAEYPLNTVNDEDDASIVGTRLNDTIVNDSGANVTIQALAGDDSIINDGGDNATIDAGTGNDFIANQGGSRVTINAGDGADTIDNNSGYNAVITAGAGDDSIENTGHNGTIDAGAGNDTLTNYFGFNMTINTGAGDDLVSLSTTSNNTVNAGAGNDTIQFVDNNKKTLIEYTAGDGSDLIEGFDEETTLSIAGGKYSSEVSGDDLIITVGNGKITLREAAELDEVHIIGEEGESALNIVNDEDNVTITGTEFEDTITNNGNNVMILALGSGDTIQNNGASVTVDGGAGNDTLNHANLFLYNAGDGEDIITAYREGDVISIDSALTFTKIRSNGDMILNMSDGGTVKLVNAANKTVTTQGKEVAAYVNFKVTGRGVTYKSNLPDSIIAASYNFKSPVLTLFDNLNDYSVGVQNNSTATLKLTDAHNFGTSTLSKGSTIGYLNDNGKVLATLSSSQFNDEIVLGENAAFNFGGLAVELTAAGKITTTGAKNIAFSNSSSALVTAPSGSEIAIGAGKFVVNNLPIISSSGAGTVSVEDDDLTFTGYGAQVADLEVAKENYYGNLAPMTVAYNTAEKNYALQNTACVKTLSYDPVQLTFDFSDATKNYTVNGEKYAYYKVNDKEFLVANDKKNINVIKANSNGFKIQDKDLDAANISRITIDDALTFKGTAIDFDGVKTTYTQGKPVSYSLDGKEISLSGAASVTTSADNKTFTCAAGTYTINGKTFTTTAALTFTADSSKIQLPLNSTGEISFDGVMASGSRGGEITFDLTNDKISIPDGATLKATSADALKLNLAAGNFTINSNEISCVTELEITADKDNIKVPLGNLPVTINGANITGSDAAQIDNAKTIVLPDGAFVSNVTENLFKLTAKNSAASFGAPDKKVLLTDDSEAYIKFGAEDTVSVGLNSVIFESVKISGGNSWTVETSGASGIDKITGINDGATISASITEGAATGLNFDVETDGAGDFTICDKKFTSTGDAKNIFTVAKTSDAIKVTTIQKSDGTLTANFGDALTVNGNEIQTAATSQATITCAGGKVSAITLASDWLTADFTDGIKINGTTDADLIKIAGKQKISVADEQITIEDLVSGSVVESFGKAEKIITTGAGNFTIGDYVYQVTDDDDGIALVKSGDDWTVENLDDAGEVTRIFDDTSYTWDMENKIWYETAEDNGPCQITIGADNKLSLTVGGQVIKKYSSRIIQSPTTGNAITDGKIVFNENVASKEISVVNNSATATAINFGTSEILAGLPKKSSVKITADEIKMLSGSSTGMTFNLDATRKNLSLAANYQITNDADNLKVTCAADSTTLSNSATVFKHINDVFLFNKAEVFKLAKGTYDINGKKFQAYNNSTVTAFVDSLELDLNSGTFYSDGVSFSGTGTAKLLNYETQLTNGAIVNTTTANKLFKVTGTTTINGKTFISGNATATIQYLYGNVFSIGGKILIADNDCRITLAGGSVSEISGIRNGTITFSHKTFKVNAYSMPTFKFNGDGSLKSIEDLAGSVEFDAAQNISINGKTFRTTSNKFTVQSNGTTITKLNIDSAGSVTTDFSAGINVNDDGAIQISGASSTVSVDRKGNISIDNVTDGTEILKYGGASQVVAVASGDAETAIVDVTFGEDVYEFKWDTTKSKTAVAKIVDGELVGDYVKKKGVEEIVVENNYTVTLAPTNSLRVKYTEDTYKDGELISTTTQETAEYDSLGVINAPKQGGTVDAAGIDFAESVLSGAVTFVNSASITPQISFAGKAAVIDFNSGASVQFANQTITLTNGELSSTTFKLGGDFNTLSLAEDYSVSGAADVKVVSGDELTLSDSATITAPADKVINFDKAATYTVNGVEFTVPANSSAKAVDDGVQFNLTTGNVFTYNNMNFTTGDTSSATIYASSQTINLADAAQVNGSYLNQKFAAQGKVQIGGKTFNVAEDSSAIEIAFSDANNFTVADKAIALDKDAVIKIDGGKVTEISDAPADLTVSGEGIAAIELKTADAGKFTISDNAFTTADDNEVTFTTDNSGAVESIGGLSGAVTGNFSRDDGFSIDDNAFTTDDDSLKVTAADDKLTAIAELDNGKFVTADFSEGIEINSTALKVSNSDKVIKVALDSDGKLSIESVAGGANVETYGDAQKIITVSNRREYSLQIGDYTYAVKDDIDDDGITFELVDGDFKVRTLSNSGKVTRYDADNKVQLWIAADDKWIDEQEYKGYYEITVNADKTLTLKANGSEVSPYSDKVIVTPKSGEPVDKNITVTGNATYKTTTFANNSDDAPNILVASIIPLFADEQIITALAANAAVKVDNSSFTLQSETATGTTFKLDANRKTLNLADDFKVTYVANSDRTTNVKLTSNNNDLTLSNCAAVTAPEGKAIEFKAGGDYSVNGISFNVTSGTKAETMEQGIKFDLSTGKVQYDGLTLEGTGTAQITAYNPDVIALTDGAIVTAGDDPFSYYNRNFLVEGDVVIVGKQFRSDKQVNAGLVYFQTSTATLNPDGTYVSETTTTTGFVVENKYVNIQSDCYDFVKVVDGKIATIEGVKTPADISGDGIQNVSILTDGGGLFTINGKLYNVSNNSVGVIFQTDSNGNVSNIKWQRGAVTANFENAININDKAVQVAGASQIKVAGDENGVTEISQVEGDWSGNSRKDVQVYNAGGASSFSTSDAGTIIFNGKTFKTDAAKLFTLDTAGNVSAISALSSGNLYRLADNSAAADSVEENSSTMTLDTTNGLEEISGDFSEGITVNGVFVKVTDSTDFVVKEDDENIYIETTSAGDFTINGKTFETEADKTIFKLDDAGNVSEIVTDTFFPDTEAYLIDGDFRDEIIFNGKKFCVTGTDKAGIFMEGSETLISLKLTNSVVNVKEGGDNSEIIASGNGTLILGDNTYQTSDDFRGFFNLTGGSVESMRYFIGTLSGKLGGVKLVDLTIATDDTFSATGDDNKVIALDNLQNATFTCGELQSVKINGATLSVTNSEDFKATISDGALAIDGLKDSAIVENTGAAVSYTVEESGEFLIGETEFKLTGDNSLTFKTDANGIVQEITGLDENARLTTSAGGTYLVNGKTLTAQANGTFIGLANNAAKLLGAGEVLLENVGENTFTFDENTTGNQNISLGGGDVAIIEEGTTAKVSITASAGEDTIYSAGKNVSINLRGGSTKVQAAGGKTSLENYDAATGAVLVTEYDDIFATIKDGDIRFGRDKVSIGAAVVNVEGDFLNFSDAAKNLQQVGFAYVDESLNASSEKSDLILVGDSGSTLRGGSGDDSIYAGEDAHIDAGAGRNLVELSGDGGAIISMSGNTTVTGFSDGDALQTSTDNLKLNFDGDNLIAKNDSAKVTLEDVAENKISLVDGAETLKAYVAQDGENISVNETADIYFGKKSGVDFSSFDESLTLDLNKNFYGINQITVGGGLNTVISSAQNETLTSSEGTTQFIFDAGAGHDVIRNFNFAEDKISVGSAVTNVVLRNSGDVIIQLGDEWITLEDAQGKSFRINDFTALVDENISYDDAANYFLATSKNASVIVSEEAEIWLDGSHGKNFVGNIKTLDASTSDGRNTLAGNDLDNVICAGGGDASLWGGNGNDLLVGGKAHNLFFYTSGNDTIQSANDGDAVILSNVTLEQISGTNFTASGVSINFKSGGSLTIDSRADLTYQLADGSQFSANHEQLTWQAR